MASVDGITAAKAQELEDSIIASASINLANGHLILTTNGGVDIDAGQVADPLALSSHIADTSTHGIASALVGLTESQSLSNKTLVLPTIASFLNAQHTHGDADGGGPLAIGKADNPAPITTLTVHTLGDADPFRVMASLNIPAGRYLILATCEGVTLGSTPSAPVRFTYDLKCSTPAVLQGKQVTASSMTQGMDGGRANVGWLDTPSTVTVQWTIVKNTNGTQVTNSALGMLLAVKVG